MRPQSNRRHTPCSTYSLRIDDRYRFFVVILTFFLTDAQTCHFPGLRFTHRSMLVGIAHFTRTLPSLSSAYSTYVRMTDHVSIKTTLSNRLTPETTESLLCITNHFVQSTPMGTLLKGPFLKFCFSAWACTRRLSSLVAVHLVTHSQSVNLPHLLIVKHTSREDFHLSAHMSTTCLKHTQSTHHSSDL